VPRDYTLREMRLVGEWVTTYYPEAIIRFRVDVGDLTPAMNATGLSQAELRGLGRSRRWVDALVVEPQTVHIVEGKVRLVPGAVAQLELYRDLFPLTPELAHLSHLDLQLHLVYAVEDIAVVALAQRKGILTHLFHPAWVDEYLALLRARETRGSQPRGLPTKGVSGPV